MVSGGGTPRHVTSRMHNKYGSKSRAAPPVSLTGAGSTAGASVSRAICDDPLFSVAPAHAPPRLQRSASSASSHGGNGSAFSSYDNTQPLDEDGNTRSLPSFSCWTAVGKPTNPCCGRRARGHACVLGWLASRFLAQTPVCFLWALCGSARAPCRCVWRCGRRWWRQRPCRIFRVVGSLRSLHVG